MGWDSDGGGAVGGGSKGVWRGWSHRVCEVGLGGAAEGRGRIAWGVQGRHHQECGSGLGPPDLECGPEPSPAVWPWDCHLLPLSLRILGGKWDGGSSNHLIAG